MKYKDNKKILDIRQLPNELIQEIILWLEMPELFLMFALTCKEFKTITNSEYSYRMLCERLLKDLRKQSWYKHRKMPKLSGLKLPLLKNLWLIKCNLIKYKNAQPESKGMVYLEGKKAIKKANEICGSSEPLFPCLFGRFPRTGEPLTTTCKYVPKFKI